MKNILYTLYFIDSLISILICSLTTKDKGGYQSAHGFEKETQKKQKTAN
jgi:hypothetical protein